MSKSYDEQFKDLEAFHEAGTMRDFFEWVDGPYGREWLGHPENCLVRWDAVLKAMFAVMRREEESLE